MFLLHIYVIRFCTLHEAENNTINTYFKFIQGLEWFNDFRHTDTKIFLGKVKNFPCSGNISVAATDRGSLEHHLNQAAVQINVINIAIWGVDVKTES